MRRSLLGNHSIPASFWGRAVPPACRCCGDSGCMEQRLRERGKGRWSLKEEDYRKLSAGCQSLEDQRKASGFIPAAPGFLGPR